MEVIEQIFSEVSQRANSPEGILRLIHLITSEVEKIDFNDPESAKKYVMLLRAYVLVKRQMAVFNRRCELVEVDLIAYKETVHNLKAAIKLKRDEARTFARDNFDPQRLKELKQSAGKSMSFHRGDITAIPVSPAYRVRSPYMGSQKDHLMYQNVEWVPGFERLGS